MSLQIGIGYSSGNDPYAVGTNACQAAYSDINEEDVAFALIITASEYEHDKVLSGVSSVIGDAPVIGTSSFGEIGGSTLLKKPSVVVVLFRGEGLSFSSSRIRIDDSDPESLGAEGARILMQELGDTPFLSFLFSDVLARSQQHRIAKGYLDTVGPSSLIGGGSSDALDFVDTRQYHNAEVLSGSAVFGGLRGDFLCGVGMRHGLLPVGAPHSATKADGVYLRTVDRKPAMTLYREYFALEDFRQFNKEPLARLTTAYPLGFRRTPTESGLVVRTPLSFESDWTLVCSDAIPAGQTVHLMIGDEDEAVKSAKEATEEALVALGKGVKPKLAFLVSGVGRKRVYGSDLNKEVETVMSVVGAETPIVGFYSYGTFGSGKGSKRPEEVFQDGSLAVCLMG